MHKKSLLKFIAAKEKVTLSFLEKQLAYGRAVIVSGPNCDAKTTVAIGEGLKIKINTNIGTSTEETEVSDEIKKLHIAAKYGTDTVMDLSTGGNLGQIRKVILSATNIPLGTVPIYEAAQVTQKQKQSFEKMTFDDIWEVLKKQAQDGVAFFTIHVGILRNFLKIIEKEKRLGGIVSRGGAILARWMYVNGQENPLYKNFDKILQLAKEYNITLSLGDALRPGAIADSTDTLQIAELKVLGQLVKKCRSYGVQVIVEGPGHIKLDEIKYNMLLEKKFCAHAPFYILGPLTTDIAAGYDHITAAIGSATAAFYGADFLCVVTPAEHLRHPSLEDIKDGVIASRIAAHSVDILRFKDEWQRDYDLSRYRAHRDWEKLFALSIDQDKARKYRQNLDPSKDMCTMCGNFCSLKIIEKCNFLK